MIQLLKVIDDEIEVPEDKDQAIAEGWIAE